MSKFGYKSTMLYIIYRKIERNFSLKINDRIKHIASHRVKIMFKILDLIFLYFLKKNQPVQLEKHVTILNFFKNNIYFFPYSFLYRDLL